MITLTLVGHYRIAGSFAACHSCSATLAGVRCWFWIAGGRRVHTCSVCYQRSAGGRVVMRAHADFAAALVAQSYAMHARARRATVLPPAMPHAVRVSRTPAPPALTRVATKSTAVTVRPGRMAVPR